MVFQNFTTKTNFGRQIFGVLSKANKETGRQAKYILYIVVIFTKIIFQFLENKDNFPVNLKFGRAKITTNEKIVLASMFYPLYALAVQLSPEQVCWSIISKPAEYV